MINLRTITIEKDAAGQRLDRYLLKLFNASSRANVYKLIRKKLFKINGVRAKEDDFLEEGDLLTVYLADESFEALIEEKPLVKPEDVGLTIVHEDEEILIVHKPSGLLTHPTRDEYKDTLATKVLFYLRDHATRTFKPAPVQRLDFNTSGLVLFAKTYEALKKFNALMRERAIEKYYLALVYGEVKDPGEIHGYMRRDEASNKTTIHTRPGRDGKEVHTRYRPLASADRYSLLEVELLTGRTHQIRASFSHIGHPLVGDQKYGGGRRAEGQLLEAYALVVGDQRYEYISEPFRAQVRAYLGDVL